jgi:hypothetical protein
MQIDIASRDKSGKPLPKGRISMGDREITPDEIGRRVKEKYRKIGEFPILIRADYDVRHDVVAKVMNACTANGIWKISFMAIAEDKTSKPGRPGRPHLSRVRKAR